MFKLFLVYRPRPGLDAGAFHEAWIAQRRAEANNPAGDIRRLALRHAYSTGIPQEGALAPTGHAWETRWTGMEELWFADERRARPIGYDSVAEGWHNSIEEMAAPFQTAEHDGHVLANADLFREITRDILATEHVLYDRRDTPLQAVG